MAGIHSYYPRLRRKLYFNGRKGPGWRDASQRLFAGGYKRSCKYKGKRVFLRVRACTRLAGRHPRGVREQMSPGKTLQKLSQG